MRKLLIVVAVFALLALGAWLALRALVDVERHEESLRAALESATGWSASFGGVEVSMARGLRLEMQDLNLTDRRGGSSIEAPRAIFRADVGALLRGELALSEVELLRPEIVIARDPARGWRWPQPGRAAPGSPELAELTVKGGRLSLAGPAASRTLRVEEISAVLTPATGRLWGTALLEGESGRIKWLGRIGEGVEVTVESADANLLASWLPGDARPGGGVVDLALRVDSAGTRCEGRLDAEGLLLFPEREPLESFGVDFSVLADEGAWRLEGVEIEAQGVKARAEGWLAPFDIRVEIEDAPLATALAASRALVRPGEPALEDEGSGRLSATLHFGGEGPRRWWWSSLVLRGARIEAGPGRAQLRDATLELGRERRDAAPLGRVRGTLAGGSLVASLRLPATERIELEGSLLDARPQRLLGAGGPEARVAMRGRATLSVAAGGGASLVAGALDIEGTSWSEPAWELSGRLVDACPELPPPEEDASRDEKAPEFENSAQDEGAPGDALEAPLPEPPPPPAGLPLAWEAELDLPEGSLRALRARGGAWQLSGSGRYLPSRGGLELELEVGPSSASLASFRASCGARLGPRDASPWPLALRVDGTLVEPRFAAPEKDEMQPEAAPPRSGP